RLVFKKLYKAGLQAAIYKYKFYIIKTKFLDFIISTDRIKVDPEKVAVIKK
ncbi:hypothetical protein BO86DRAFT_317462, partial [Aspergillus japonicus CBS 114.51]